MRARPLFLVVALGALVGIGFACLPDLLPPPADFCGSGYVDLASEACDPGDAGATGCTAACAIDCEGGVVDPSTTHCYFWAPPARSNDFGMTECGNAQAHVVSFVDPDELAFVVQNTKTLPGAPDGGGGTWLALTKGLLDEAGVQTYVPYTGLTVPGWSAACPGCYANADGGDADLPLAGSNPQFCVFWRRSVSASWVQQVCDLGSGNQVPVLCEREPPGSFSTICTDEAGTPNTCIAVPRTKGTKRYELVASPKSFDLARADCEARGGALVRFESSAEREEVIAEVAQSLAGGDVWIGLAFDADAGGWSWVDGTPAPAAFPTPWADGEPSVSAGAASIHIDVGRYDTRLARAQADTTQVLQYVCQFAAK